jgi:hypothetical protein
MALRKFIIPKEASKHKKRREEARRNKAKRGILGVPFVNWTLSSYSLKKAKHRVGSSVQKSI